MRTRTCCLNCGYCIKESEDRYYCNDRDCLVDPYEPDCNDGE